jgi:hypothetical protein
MPITVRFTNTPQLLYQAQSALTRHIKWMRWGGIFVVWIFPLFMVGLQLASGQPPASAVLNSVGWIIGAPLFWLLGIPLVQRWQASRSLQTTPALQGEQVYVFDDTEISVSAGLSRGTTNWRAIVRFVETPNLFLLFLSNQVAYFIPKHGFASEADVAQFTKLLAEKVPVIP